MHTARNLQQAGAPERTRRVDRVASAAVISDCISFWLMSAASTAALRRPALGRPARAGRCLRARSGRDFFGKDGMRAQSGSRDLSQLLGGGGGGAGGGGGLDLGQGVDLGPAAEPSGEDPLNYDPEGTQRTSPPTRHARAAS